MGAQKQSNPNNPSSTSQPPSTPTTSNTNGGFQIDDSFTHTLELRAQRFHADDAAPTPTRRRGVSPIARALCAQALSAVIVLSMIQPTIDEMLGDKALVAGAMAVGVLAALMTRLFNLPNWWFGIQLGLPPLILLAQQANLPNWIYLLGFVLLFALSPRAFWGRIPLYLSRSGVSKELAARIPQGARVIDIGCGPGGLIASLAQQRSDLVCEGIEFAPLTFLAAKWRAAWLDNCEIRYGSFWGQYWGEYDVVYAYLSPVPMADVWSKARREMRRGSWLISNEFTIPGVEPIASFEMPNGTVRIYEIP